MYHLLLQSATTYTEEKYVANQHQLSYRVMQRAETMLRIISDLLFGVASFLNKILYLRADENTPPFE